MVESFDEALEETVTLQCQALFEAAWARRNTSNCLDSPKPLRQRTGGTGWLAVAHLVLHPYRFPRQPRHGGVTYRARLLRVHVAIFER